MSVKSSVGIDGIHTVAIPVTDHDRSIDFYINTLGFEKRLEATFGPGRRWVEVAPQGSPTTIALAPVGPTAKPGTDTGIRLTTADAEASHAQLRASGVDVDAEVMRFGEGVPPMFSFRDPDGNRLYIVQGG